MVLVGPFVVTAVSQGRYILAFIDDFSRYTWVYFLHHKNELLDKFLAFKTHVEQKSRKAIKVLRMENKRKYVNRILKDLCKLKDIDLQNLAPFNPRKIDVTTLRIRILKSMASCMI